MDREILVETSGVGQSEVDIIGLADIVVVVCVPGLGDDIQAMKAGIMEIGDLFAVNKADREGADRTANEIRAALDMPSGDDPDAAGPELIATIAETGEGVELLLDAIDRRYAELAARGSPSSTRKPLMGSLSSSANVWHSRDTSANFVKVVFGYGR